MGAPTKTTRLKRLKRHRPRVVCILGVLLLPTIFGIGLITLLWQWLFPAGDKTGKTEHPQRSVQTPSPCHVSTVRPATLTIFAGTEIGTGSIVSSDGLVLTNEHVVREIGVGNIRARQWGGKRKDRGQKGKLYTGQVLATDPNHDLALIKLNTEERLPTIAFAKANELQSGQAVCALGSPRAITGVLAKGHLIGIRGANDLQSNIMLQPGNSGGPLLNAQGKMIGVNKSILLSATGTNEERSFATTVAVASAFFEKHKNIAVSTERSIADHAAPVAIPSEPLDFNPPIEPPFNPDTLQSASGARLGAIVDGETLIIQIVEPESPAEKAGLNAGDRLTQVDGKPLHSIDAIQTFLDSNPNRATFTVSRDSRLQAVTVEF